MTFSNTTSVSCARRINRSIFSILTTCGTLAATMLLAGFSTCSHAGMVQNLHAAELDAIFSQASFGSNIIDIRFNPSQTLYNSAWLKIETDPFSYASGQPYPDVLGALTTASGLANSLTIPMFFVDGYTSQGIPNSTIGLGWMGDNGISVLTSFQTDLTIKPAGTLPCPPEMNCPPGAYLIDPAVTQTDIEAHYWVSASLVAHELGHNLGLTHTSFPGLMYPTSSNPANYTLTSAQVATILSSPFVQMDTNGQRFISITPFSVLDSTLTAVPLPSAWLMFSLGLGLLARRALSCVRVTA